MSRWRRQISFDFAPGRPASEVIKEIRQKAVKEVVMTSIKKKNQNLISFLKRLRRLLKIM